MTEQNIEDEHHIQWNDELNLAFANAIVGHKVVGVEKNFHMAIIHEKFQNITKLQIGTKQLWDKLKTYFDLELLEEHQPNPPWDEDKATPYMLPDFLIPTNKPSDSGSVSSVEAPNKKVTPSASKPTNSNSNSSSNKKRLRGATPSASQGRRRKN